MPYLKQYRADEVVDMVVSGRVAVQVRAPVFLCYRRADPLRAPPLGYNNLKHGQTATIA